MTAQVLELKPNATVEANYSGKPLKLSQFDLIAAWTEGLLPTPAYVYLAMRLDGVGSVEAEDFDMTDFCDRWEGPENEKGKCKRLDSKDVMAVLRKLEKMGRGQIEMTMQLKLTFD